MDNNATKISASPGTFTVIASAISTNWINNVIGLISGLITLPLMVMHLGKTQYGIWVLVVQTVSIFALSDLGTANSISRFVAKYRGKNDTESLHRVLSTAMAIMTASAILLVVLTLLLMPRITGLLGIDDSFSDVTKLVFLISGLSMALMFPFRIGMEVLMGYQLYIPHGIMKIVMSLSILSGVVTFAATDRLNVVTLAVLMGTVPAVAHIALTVYAWRRKMLEGLSIRHVSFNTCRNILSLGGGSLVMTMSAMAYNQGMIIASGHLIGTEAAGIFGVAWALMNKVKPFIGIFGTPFNTLASEWQAKDQLDKLNRTINAVLRVTIALASSFAAGIIIYGKPALKLLLSKGEWSSADFDSAGNALSIMAIGLAIGLPQVVSRSTLMGTGKHWQTSIGTSIVSALAIGIGVIAMSAGMGIEGAAIGWTSTWIMLGTAFYPPMVCHYFKISGRSMIVQAYLPGFGVGLIVFVASLAFSTIMPPVNLSNFIIQVLFCALAGGTLIVAVSGKAGRLLSVLTRKKG